MAASEEPSVNPVPAGTEVEGSHDPGHTAEGMSPRIWMVVLIAFVSIFFTIAWLVAWQVLDGAIWESEVVEGNRWLVPALVILFSLLVGLCIKHLDAETAIGGGLAESMRSAPEKGEWRRFPGSLLSSFLSLLSGASLGPEGALASLIRGMSSWFQEKLRLGSQGSLGYSIAALSSAYNGIIGQPLFTAVFATELGPDKKDALASIAWNLLAGVIGFLVFSSLGFASFMGSIPLPAMEGKGLEYVAYAILMGVLGALIAFYLGSTSMLFGKLMDPFRDKAVFRILAAGAVIAAVAYFLPELMFSGEEQIHEIMDDPARYGAGALLLMGLLKMALLSLSLKSGYLGGPIFPVLFGCTLIGLALNLAFPGVPVILTILCLEAASISLALGAPLSSILLVTLVSSAGQITPYLVALIVLATATSMLLGVPLRKLMAGGKAVQ